MELPVLHWHHDSFDIPPGALHLADSTIYANQAFLTGHCAYGLQFHVELDAALARAMADHLPDGAQLAEQDRVKIERQGRKIVAAFFDAALGRPRP